MFTLPDRYEFLSDDWIYEARRVLEKAVEQRKGELGGQPFSLSERRPYQPKTAILERISIPPRGERRICRPTAFLSTS
jgi:hypothetical protein